MAEAEPCQYRVRVEPLTRQTLKIVQVDDDVDFSRLSNVTLRRAGFTRQIVHFGNALLGLQYILAADGASLPHVVLLDVQMPCATGFEVLEQIRRQYDQCELAVFLMTSSYEPQDRDRAKSLGATKYLDKLHSLQQVVVGLDELISERNRSMNAADYSRFPQVRQFLEFPRR